MFGWYNKERFYCLRHFKKQSDRSTDSSDLPWMYIHWFMLKSVRLHFIMNGEGLRRNRVENYKDRDQEIIQGIPE